jgi:predicted metal-dependent phosphoesterase TrpH
MSPIRIVEEALNKHIDILAITDHNSTRQCRVVMQVGEKAGLTVWGGAEINTREEVHCLALFDDLLALGEFQRWLDNWLPHIKNKPHLFGDQVWVDEDENILGEEERLLISALNRSLEQSYRKVHELGGVFAPAHIDRKSFSLTSQLGFVPPLIQADALEVSWAVTAEEITRRGWQKIKPLIAGSDAHRLEQLGTHLTLAEMARPTLGEFKKALQQEDGRRAAPEKFWGLLPGVKCG